jgi:hypothetical protein
MKYPFSPTCPFKNFKSKYKLLHEGISYHRLRTLQKKCQFAIVIFDYK